MTPSLNAFQSEQLHAFMARHAEDEAVASNFGEKPHPVIRLEWFPCEVPGMVAIIGRGDDTMELLYPTPRPVPRDPLFQHADDIIDSRRYLLMLHLQPEFRRDWQTLDFMDAPDHFPAGSCEYFANSEDTYGASQTTFYREAW